MASPFLAGHAGQPEEWPDFDLNLGRMDPRTRRWKRIVSTSAGENVAVDHDDNKHVSARLRAKILAVAL